MEWASALWGCTTCLSIIVTYFGIWCPYKLHTFYRRQKLKGPEYRPLIGNWTDIWNLKRKLARIKLHNVQPADAAVRSLPHLFHWSKLHGSMFTYMEGTKLNLCVLNIDIIRELLVSKSDCYRRNPAGWFCWNKDGISRPLPEQLETCKAPNVMPHIKSDRLLTLGRILGPGTDYDCNTVQEILHRTIDQCKTLVNRWKELIDEAYYGEDGRVEVDATHDIAKTSMDIVLMNLIGSTLSNRDLEMIDSILNSAGDGLENTTTTRPLFCGHFRGFRSNKDGWVNRLLTDTTLSRIEALQRQGPQDPKDLLDLMLASSNHSGVKDVKQLVKDCKMMVAAQKSTTYLINNTLLLLARHTDWQVQARAEVKAILPLRYAYEEDADGLSVIYPELAKLKVLNMILNESLRLAPPIISIEKLCQKRNRLGKYTVLPGTVVQIPIVLLHYSHELWGEDSSSFRPDRFEHDASKPKPFALLPFSAGPSVCLGFSFALVEAKIVLASILDNFSFHLSPIHGTDAPFLSIRKLQLNDIAEAAKERLFTSQSSFS